MKIIIVFKFEQSSYLFSLKIPSTRYQADMLPGYLLQNSYHLYRIVHMTCPSPGSCTDLTIQLPDSFSTFLSGKFQNACYVCRTDDSTTRTGCSTRYLKHGNVQQHLSSNFYLRNLMKVTVEMSKV